ncbi:GLTP domain-containing protein [Rhizoctonia solani AG-1 IA]|uniref:GLTP domain-containing protein n=1 Tax=Thanatephorus cucumeris (strain AG1-IA) TaxID=983506 RepID=L8WQG8_THACA|nr:GLTP domain-containing protein [Rhizoctonia solani AG-1 IA]
MNEAPVSPKDIESTKIEYAIDLVVLFCPKLLSFKNVEVVLDINLGGGVIIARRIVPGPSSKMVRTLVKYRKRGSGKVALSLCVTIVSDDVLGKPGPRALIDLGSLIYKIAPATKDCFKVSTTLSSTRFFNDQVMSNFIQSLKKSFVDVPVTEDGVETASFLDASEGLCALFGMPRKVRTRLNSHPSESATLEKLVANEKKESKQPATEGLMWLLRGLAFTCKALQHCQADQTAELTAGFNKSYPETLKPYHNFVVKGVFAACPYRKDFYTKIGSPPDDQLNAWLGALDAIVTRMDAFYKAGGHGEVYKA